MKSVTYKPPIPFERLHGLSVAKLKSFGCRGWDDPDVDGDVLMLFPGTWYDSIPNGFMVAHIDGRVTAFRRGRTSKDLRLGMLSYGIVAKGRR
jgi:hypothetical protein